MNFNRIWRKSLSGHRETTWHAMPHCMRISLSTYAILPTNVILSTSFPLLMNIFNIQHKLAALTPVDQIRDLGITVSSNLSWTSHIRSSCDKVRKMAAWVISVFHTRNTGVMLTLYKSPLTSP